MVAIKDHQIKEEIFGNPILSTYLKGLRLCGYISGYNQVYHQWHYIRFVLMVIVFVAFFLVMFPKMFFNINELNEGHITRASAFHTLAFVVMLINASFQRGRIFKLINYLHDDLLKLRSCTDNVEDQFYRNTIKNTRFLTYSLWIPALVSSTAVALNAWLRVIFWPETILVEPQLHNATTKQNFMFNAYPIGDVFGYKALNLIGPSYVMMVIAFIVPLWFTFTPCLIKYVIFKIDIVSKRVQEMDFTKINSDLGTKEDIERLTESEKNFWRLKMCEYCVNEQNNIRWFVEEIQQVIRVPIFVDFILYSMVMCFALYSLALGNLDKSDTYMLMEFIGIILFYLWLNYSHGTSLSDSFEGMCFSIYSCDWYNYSIQVQKSIRFLMMQSLKPLGVRAIFVDLQQETYVAIVRAAVGYYRILRNLNEI